MITSQIDPNPNQSDDPEIRTDRYGRRTVLGLFAAGALSAVGIAAAQVDAKHGNDDDGEDDNSDHGGGDDDNSGHGGGDDDASNDEGHHDGDDDASATPGSSAPKSASVTIKDFAFHPEVTRIAVGGTVTWTNAGPVSHNVIGDFAQSNTLGTGDTFKWTFKKVGTYDYQCTLHPGMTGTVTVEDSNATPVAASPEATGDGASVAIVDFAFDPAELSVPSGAAVTWTNMDSTMHTVTGSFADSGPIDSGGTFSFTFEKAGTFSYVCAFHSNMTAKITVSG